MLTTITHITYTVLMKTLNPAQSIDQSMLTKSDQLRGKMTRYDTKLYIFHEH